jgi:hypothetical protein
VLAFKIGTKLHDDDMTASAERRPPHTTTRQRLIVNMSENKTVIRDITPEITTFSVPFNRFAPFGLRKFVAVGNRATAIRLHDSRILRSKQH